MRRAAKRDKNENQLLSWLRTVGFSCGIINEPGIPDLIVAKHVNFLIEIKSESGSLTTAQKEFFKSWTGQAVVVRSLDDLRRFLFKQYLIHQFECECGTQLVMQNILEPVGTFVCECGHALMFKETVGHIHV